jgi:cysteine desulfurase
MKNRIYLDNNASTEIAPEVLQVMLEELQRGPANPSSIHAYGQEARNRLTKARRSIASYFQVSPAEVIFTSGGTEALNMVLRGISSSLQDGQILTTSVEHAAVFQTLHALERKGCEVTYLPIGKYGAASADDLLAAITPKTKLIALMAVNNETGVKTDIQTIAAIAEERRIPFVVDGVAWLGKEALEIPAGVSAICFSGHKLHAPKGTGLAIVRKQLKLEPLFTGGSQESERRAGTENVPGIVALEEAIRLIQRDLPAAEERMRALQARLETGVLSLIPNVTINGEGPRICNTSNIAFHGVEGESLLIALDLAGIAASHGSACSSGSLEPSRVLLNMGLSKAEAGSSLRFSTSRYTTAAEIDTCISVLVDIVNKLRCL